MLRVVLPQLLPRLLDLAAPDARFGVAVPDRRRGHRLHRRPRLPDFLVRRYLAMDVILPYVCGSPCSPG